MASAGVRFPEINLLIVSGRLVRDAEMAFTPGGAGKCAMRVAVNRRVKDSKTGEWREESFFVDVVAWRELAERSKDKAKKGIPVIVEGRLSGREYEDQKSGQKRSVFEIVANRIQFLGRPAGEDATAGPPAADGRSAGDDPEKNNPEEVPF
jgi:single-strand DNA-binding protein